MFERRVKGKFGWYKGGDEKKDWKYVGEIKNGKPNGHGTLTKPKGSKYVGKFKDENFMIKELTTGLIETSMLENTKMGNITVRD